MTETVRINDEYYVLATAAHADEGARVLKQGDTFALFDHYGNIRSLGLKEQGLYHQGTRHLSSLVLRLGRMRPLLLSSSVVENNMLLAVDLTNADLEMDGQVIVPRGTLHMFQSKFLWNGVCYQRIRVHNYGFEPVEVDFQFEFDADFLDVFEVRGSHPQKRGRQLPVQVQKDRVVYTYEGLDGVTRRTILTSLEAGAEFSPRELRFRGRIEPKDAQNYYFTICCEQGKTATPSQGYDQASSCASEHLQAMEKSECRIGTSNGLFNEWLERSIVDLRMLVTETEAGPYPYAGIPWYCTEFGRDALITGFQTLWLNPSIARGVLCFLSATQAKHDNASQDAEPGKIVHEMRRGEMASTGEVPFGRYYGSVDATPLYVMLAGQYYEATGDKALATELWPNIALALEWMARYGDSNGDGFLDYSQRSAKGLSNQGWKDSTDSVFHSDGRLAEGPIALCEVQAYAYAAKRAGSKLAHALGHFELGAKLASEADLLQRKFEEAYWCEDLGTYALALDGKQQPCRVKTSNAGHALFAGIASGDHARRVAQLLTTDELFSGWGVRTVASSERRYNPMSYHNGSVWPHDNALIALGMGRYGFPQQALRVLQALFDASPYFELHRVPELFCGFGRRGGEGPTLYPVACSPQAWAAGAVLMLLQGCLGMTVNGVSGQLRFCRPMLPDFLESLELANLRVGTAVVDLHIRRFEAGASIDVIRQSSPIELVVVR